MSVESRLPIDAARNLLLPAFASWPSSRSKLWLLKFRTSLSVLVQVQSVAFCWVSLREFASRGSEFSGRIGLNPAKDAWNRLKPRFDRKRAQSFRAKPANALPKTRLFFEILSFAPHA